MKRIKSIAKTLAKVVGAIVLVALIGVIVTSPSPIYDFAEPRPFAGDAIFNPYRHFDREQGWKRSAFHVHTKVDGLLNECQYWPDEVHRRLEEFGYDIIAFANHNIATAHPFDAELQIDCYEHGYNLFKFHKLVFGGEVNPFDHLVPLLASQKQFQIATLGSDADIVVLNHPLRTHTLASGGDLKHLAGYRIMELDSGKSTENGYWDEALSAGHYSFGLANDDLHYPDRSHCIAMRCNFLATESARYADVRETLLGGAFYAMRLPNYGDGDWEVKRAKNRTVPRITDIGLRDNVVYMTLSDKADSVRVTGQGGATLALHHATDSVAYAMCPEDSYARLTAYFAEGEVIYTNPFARYDSTRHDSPYDGSLPSVNITLTVLFNALLAVLLAVVVYLLYKLTFKR